MLFSVWEFNIGIVGDHIVKIVPSFQQFFLVKQFLLMEYQKMLQKLTIELKIQIMC